jgi:hypothetical protein
MAKCKNCGKSGLFFKINSNGICKECDRIFRLQEEERQLKENIAKMQTEYLLSEKAYNEINAKRDVTTQVEEPYFCHRSI